MQEMPRLSFLIFCSLQSCMDQPRIQPHPLDASRLPLTEAGVLDGLPIAGDVAAAVGRATGDVVPSLARAGCQCRRTGSHGRGPCGGGVVGNGAARQLCNVRFSDHSTDTSAAPRRVVRPTRCGRTNARVCRRRGPGASDVARERRRAGAILVASLARARGNRASVRLGVASAAEGRQRRTSDGWRTMAIGPKQTDAVIRKKSQLYAGQGGPCSLGGATTTYARKGWSRCRTSRR